MLSRLCWEISSHYWAGFMLAGMKQAMLELVASGAGSSAHDIARYTNCTLLASTPGASIAAAKDALRWLGTPKEQEASGIAKGEALIAWDTANKVYKPTTAGKAVLSTGLSIEDAMAMKVR